MSWVRTTDRSRSASSERPSPVGGEADEVLVAPRDREGVAVEVERADHRVPHDLVVMEAGLDVVVVPQLGKLGAAPAQGVDHGADHRVVRIAAGGGAPGRPRCRLRDAAGSGFGLRWR